ncbi:GTD-binding domain [Sesbania bispinosa]|nr:GTD-binding domain [Sesbania bispinosa]
MDSDSCGDSVNCCKCHNCGCDCSIAASQTQSSRNWPRSVKRRHDEFEKNNQNLDDSVVRVEIGDECNELRQAVSRQQKAMQDLYEELEEERNAASSAANETMSMILRLQREKAELQMEARQFKRLMEERTSHDEQELLALEDLLYKREQAIQSLACEVQAYKHRLMSFGLSESEAESDQFEFPPYEYPPLKCNMDGEFSGKNVLEKVIVGQSPRWTKHSRKFSCDSSSLGPEFLIDSPKLNGSFKKTDYVSQSEDWKKVDNASEVGDDMTDRVYTIDSVFKAGGSVFDDYVTTPREFGNHADFEDPYIKKLCMRLQALEADRESMKQAIISMRTDKTQLVLLKEIAQQLCKEMSSQRKMTGKSPAGKLSFLTVFKWIASTVFWRKKAHQIKYMFGLPSDSVGLLMLLDKDPHVRSWRYLSSTQV